MNVMDLDKQMRSRNRVSSGDTSGSLLHTSPRRKNLHEKFQVGSDILG